MPILRHEDGSPLLFAFNNNKNTRYLKNQKKSTSLDSCVYLKVYRAGALLSFLPPKRSQADLKLVFPHIHQRTEIAEQPTLSKPKVKLCL